MKDASTFLPLLSEFISTYFKNYRVWDIEITFPQSTKETSRGYYTHGLLEVSATNTEDEWDSHSFEFNSPNKIRATYLSFLMVVFFMSLLKMIVL